MAQNKLEDLRNHLFAQLERLNDENLNPEELKLEVNRAKAISQVSSVIIQSAVAEIDFLKLKDNNEHLRTNSQLFKSIES